MWLRWQQFKVDPSTGHFFPGNKPEWLLETEKFCRFWFSSEPFWTCRTSGSTSAPKSIQLSREAIVHSARASLDFFRFNPEKEGFALLLPAQAAGGFMLLARAFLAEMDVLLLPPKNESLRAENFPPDKKWFTPLLPLQLQRLLSGTDTEKISAAMSGILLGGGPLEASVASQLHRLRCPVFHSYGMTETASHIALRKIHPGKEEKAFRTLDGISCRLTSDGCLEISAPEITGTHWLQTRDLAEINPDGSFVITGRADNRINSGGLKIQPESEKERLAKLLPQSLQDMELTGLPDAELGEKLVMVLFRPPEGAVNEIAKLLKNISDPDWRRRLPRSVICLNEERPLLPGGKTDFKELRRKIQEISPAIHSPENQK